LPSVAGKVRADRIDQRADLLLASAGLEVGFRNGFSLGARFDGEFAENSRTYSGMGWVRYTW